MTLPVRLAACLAAALLGMAVPGAGQAAEARRGAQRTAPAPTPIALAARPGTPLDRAARQLAAQDLAQAGRPGEEPLLLVGSAAVGRPNDPEAVFVQLQSTRDCGSAGCSTSAYFRGRKVLDGVSGPVALDTRRHNGVRDLMVGEGERYTWTGTTYANTRPAPAVSLRPRHPRS